MCIARIVANGDGVRYRYRSKKMTMTKPNNSRKPARRDGENRIDADLQHAVVHHILYHVDSNVRRRKPSC